MTLSLAKKNPAYNGYTLPLPSPSLTFGHKAVRGGSRKSAHVPAVDRHSQGQRSGTRILAAVDSSPSQGVDQEHLEMASRRRVQTA